MACDGGPSASEGTLPTRALPYERLRYLLMNRSLIEFTKIIRGSDYFISGYF
jgi:hypothetical protein